MSTGGPKVMWEANCQDFLASFGRLLLKQLAFAYPHLRYSILFC